MPEEKWFWDNSNSDRDTLQRSKYTQVSDGSRSEAPTGALMRLYYSSAVPRQGSDRDRLCCEYNGFKHDANADALQDV